LRSDEDTNRELASSWFQTAAIKAAPGGNMFVRRHRFTIEIEQQTLRIHQRTASTDPDPMNPDTSNPEQSHHNSATDIVPGTKLPLSDSAHGATPDSFSDTASIVPPETKALQAPKTNSVKDAL
jgi:hypothetical protein